MNLPLENHRYPAHGPSRDSRQRSEAEGTPEASSGPGRFRARFAQGASTSDWVELKVATGLRPGQMPVPAVALFRIGLIPAGQGEVAVENISPSRLVCDPGAQLVFANNRTGETTRITATETGTFPPGIRLSGKPGDTFAIAATFDAGESDPFLSTLGQLTVPVPGHARSVTEFIAAPALHDDEVDSSGRPRFGKLNFKGELFVGRPCAQQVHQGALGDSSFSAALAAMAQFTPEVVASLIRHQADGTFLVTFKQRNWATGQLKEVPITLDADFYVRPDGTPLYGRCAPKDSDFRQSGFWFPLLEKAYAQWKGSYHAIGQGGCVSDVFEECTGVEAASWCIKSAGADAVWDHIVLLVDAGRPSAAGTYSDDNEARYTNTPVCANHAYTVLGYEKMGAERRIVLRNPWGECQTSGHRDDGIFTLKLEQFISWYQSLYFQT